MVNDIKEAIRKFWDEHPLCSYEIKEPLGSKEFFEQHSKLRYEIERFAYDFHEVGSHKGDLLLDIGCGIGFVVCEYAMAGVNVLGIDHSIKAVELTKERLNIQGLSGKIFVADAESLPFKNNIFDLVTAMGVLHHTPHTEEGVK